MHDRDERVGTLHQLGVAVRHEAVANDQAQGKRGVTGKLPLPPRIGEEHLE